MIETSFTRLVGCRLPLQQAGMGGSATAQLASAVSEAGGLGMLGLTGMPVGVAAAAVEAAAARTSRPFGVNFLMPFLDREAVEIAASRCRVVEFFYGDPDTALVAAAHAGGAFASWQVGSLEEARAAADSGCDMVVVQGVEAGGHVRGQVGLLPLLDLVLDAVPVPVVAAGGLGSARAVAAVIAAGAAAARVGTRFLAAEEADVHPSYLDALVRARAEDTVVTTTFSQLWPDAPHRVLRSCVGAALDMHDDVIGQTELAPGIQVPVLRLSPPSPGRSTTGQVEGMALYAGQSVDHVAGRTTAAQIVAELTTGL
ncbi:MAG TPA: nitronate monooxygenase [Acidimicrobiales bacterium]|nr:nitronate monooxygenase [Acidimicrobiales bacterium]